MSIKTRKDPKASFKAMCRMEYNFDLLAVACLCNFDGVWFDCQTLPYFEQVFLYISTAECSLLHGTVVMKQ